MSSSFHKQGEPLLASSILLREFGCGQVDMARIECSRSGEMIRIMEVKTRAHIGPNQLGRLRNSAEFLGKLLKRPAILTFFHKEEGNF